MFSSAAGSTAGRGTFGTINISTDKNEISLTSVRAGLFSWSQSGNDLLLTYTTVPETVAIFAFVALYVAWRARRWSST